MSYCLLVAVLIPFPEFVFLNQRLSEKTLFFCFFPKQPAAAETSLPAAQPERLKRHTPLSTNYGCYCTNKAASSGVLYVGLEFFLVFLYFSKSCFMLFATLPLFPNIITVSLYPVFNSSSNSSSAEAETEETI